MDITYKDGIYYCDNKQALINHLNEVKKNIDYMRSPYIDIVLNHKNIYEGKIKTYGLD
jgi:hypothetical protein